MDLDTSTLKKPEIRHINFEILGIFRVVKRFLVGNPDLTQGSVQERGSEQERKRARERQTERNTERER